MFGEEAVDAVEDVAVGGICFLISVFRTNFRQSMACETELSGFGSSVQNKAVPPSQESVVPGRMCRADSARPSRLLGRNNHKSFLFFSVKKCAERVIEVVAEDSDLLPRFNDYKVSKEKLEYEQSQQNLTSMAMTVLMKQLFKKGNLGKRFVEAGR